MKLCRDAPARVQPLIIKRHLAFRETGLTLVKRLVLGCALVVCGFGLTADAQLVVYGEATGSSLRFQETPHMYGGTFGIYKVKQVGPVALGADFRGVMVKRGGSLKSINDTKLDEGQFGFRAAASPHVLPFSLMPYGEALVGLGYWRGGYSALRQDKTHFLVQGIAGVDVPVYKSIDWRVVEFSYARAGAQPGFINPISVSTGIVIHLPEFTRSPKQ